MGEEITISYETLYDLLRTEKAKFELQKLDPGFFSQVLRYLEYQLLQIQQSKYKTDLFSSTERSKAEMQLHNAKKMLRDLYERRERKIIDMALNKSKTDTAIIDANALLQEERAFFEALVILFDRYREGVLNNIFQLKHPLIALSHHDLHIDDFEEPKHPADIEEEFRKEGDNEKNKEESDVHERGSEESNESEKQESTESSYGDSKYQDSSILKQTEANILHSNHEEKRKTIFDELKNEEKDNFEQINKGVSPSPSSDTPSSLSKNEIIPLKFLKAVERFIDEDLQYYGPFAQGETAEIPLVVANILLEQGKAEKISKV